MNPEELQALEKEVAKAKRIASEWASKLHDLVEDRLPANRCIGLRLPARTGSVPVRGQESLPETS